jgi:aryl-alcohol dehydrogenase-like predicted oxidoreductase
MVDLCETEDIAFLPWAPIQDFEANPTVDDVASHHRVTPTQVVLAWLLARSSAMLPIPGTGRVPHLEENVSASSVHLAPEEVAALRRAG